MTKQLCLFFSSIFLTCLLVACSSKPALVESSKISKARDTLFSNSVLLPSDPVSHLYWPLTQSLTKEIRAVNGEVYQSGSFVTIVLPDDALFEPGTSVLLPEAYALIEDLARIIVRFPDDSVIITGHTDGIGSGLYQAKLSRQQAQLFALTLWQQDRIDLKTFQRFQYAGMADARPITEDPSAYGQALNRRIQITIYPLEKMEEMKEMLGQQEIEQI